jgi:mono/diheme cytochrome c family protein
MPTTHRETETMDYVTRNALAGALATAIAGSAGAEAFLPWQDPEAVAHGAEVYAAACASCHGADLQGQPDWRSPGPDGLLPAPPHDPTGHTWHHPDSVLFQITKYGTEAVVRGGYRSAMAGFGDVLSDSDIVAVLAYIKSTWPPRIRAIHDQVNAGG